MDSQSKQEVKQSHKARNRNVKFNNKIIKVVIIGDAKKEFDKLNKITFQEISQGITNSKSQTLLDVIKRKIELLKKDPEYGIHLSKNKIPKKYIKQFGINNVWKINLPDAWRMVYTIQGNKIEIISLVIDIFDHKHYEKMFNYKKS